jgi:hypothetical protein
MSDQVVLKHAGSDKVAFLALLLYDKAGGPQSIKIDRLRPPQRDFFGNQALYRRRCCTNGKTRPGFAKAAVIAL